MERVLTQEQHEKISRLANYLGGPYMVPTDYPEHLILLVPGKNRPVEFLFRYPPNCAVVSSGGEAKVHLKESDQLLPLLGIYDMNTKVLRSAP